MHGHMYSDSLGAAAGCAPERSSLGGGVPSVGNAGFVGRVIQLAAGSNMMKVKIKKKTQHFYLFFYLFSVFLAPQKLDRP